LRDRALVLSLGVSLTIHLSMVTVFSIVLYLPREDIRYYAIRIMEPERSVQAREAGGGRLRVPSVDDSLAAQRVSGAEDGLPDIELPTLEFAELRRLRVSEQGLTLGNRRETILEPKPRDSWARFGEEVGLLRGALSRLSPLGGGIVEEPQPEPEPEPVPVTRPAAGFEGYIEWAGTPQNRPLLFAPPMKVLWGLSPSDLAEPIVLELTVDPQGQVVSVWSPRVDNSDLVTGAQNAVLKYRFEPVEGDRMQHATLHVTGARNRP
jgi:hypothetical protein